MTHPLLEHVIALPPAASYSDGRKGGCETCPVARACKIEVQAGLPMRCEAVTTSDLYTLARRGYLEALMIRYRALLPQLVPQLGRWKRRLVMGLDNGKLSHDLPDWKV